MTQLKPFPKIGEVFELTANEEITGLGLAADNFVLSPQKGWRSDAKPVPANTTKRFKLVYVGCQNDLDAVARACKAQGGKTPSGCWLKVFDETFGHNGNNPVGVPDASWVNPYGIPRFPMIEYNGVRDFGWSRGNRNASWLWLVEVD